MENKPRKTWLVLEGMEGGYMPDSAYAYRTKAEAITAAKWARDNAREDGYIVTGNIRRDEVYIVKDRHAGSNTLNNYIEVTRGEDMDDADFEAYNWQ